MTLDELTEEIAKIIDPNSFESWDRRIQYVLARGEGIEEAIALAAHYDSRGDAREKAAAIVALLPTSVLAIIVAAEPFVQFGRDNVDDHGWTSTTGRERIVDWFGPSDFRNLIVAIGANKAADDA